jgi:hypothetical protein
VLPKAGRGSGSRYKGAARPRGAGRGSRKFKSAPDAHNVVYLTLWYLLNRLFLRAGCKVWLWTPPTRFCARFKTIWSRIRIADRWFKV